MELICSSKHFVADYHNKCISIMKETSRDDSRMTNATSSCENFVGRVSSIAHVDAVG